MQFDFCPIRLFVARRSFWSHCNRITFLLSLNFIYNKVHLIIIMLCVICNNNVHQGDEFQCIRCKEFTHFICAGFREEQFCKMNKQAKKIWSCTSSKFGRYKNNLLRKTNKSLTSKGNEITDEILNGVIESVQNMSTQFDNFSQLLKALVSTINELKDENKCIKEENTVLK